MHNGKKNRTSHTLKRVQRRLCVNRGQIRREENWALAAIQIIQDTQGEGKWVEKVQLIFCYFLPQISICLEVKSTV
jgi:hypothetical protein